MATARDIISLAAELDELAAKWPQLLFYAARPTNLGIPATDASNWLLESPWRHVFGCRPDTDPEDRMLERTWCQLQNLPYEAGIVAKGGVSGSKKREARAAIERFKAIVGQLEHDTSQLLPIYEAPLPCEETVFGQWVEFILIFGQGCFMSPPPRDGYCMVLSREGLFADSAALMRRELPKRLAEVRFYSVCEALGLTAGDWSPDWQFPSLSLHDERQAAFQAARAEYSSELSALSPDDEPFLVTLDQLELIGPLSKSALEKPREGKPLPVKPGSGKAAALHDYDEWAHYIRHSGKFRRSDAERVLSKAGAREKLAVEEKKPAT